MAEKKKKPFKGYNKKKHSRTGGLNDKERARINREEGSNLKRPVTGKVKAGSKAANRRKSFCARMAGVKGPTSKDGQLTPKGAALKRWKCRKSLQKSDIPPKAKLAAFLRDHIDNKLALKAAEPTITKSGELEKAISPEQQKENIRKQRELQNKKIVEEMKGKTSLAALKNKIAEQNLKHTKEDVDQAVWENPMEAAEKFGYSKFLTSNHIDDIVQQAPHEAARFIDHNKLNQSHIDTIVENDPEGAAEYLYKHPLLNANHIQTIAENAPEIAALYLRNHKDFNANHIQTIVDNNPSAAAGLFRQHSLLTADHIQTIIEKDPRVAAECLNNHHLLNEQHIDTIVKNLPKTVARYHLKNNPIYKAKYGNKIKKSSHFKVVKSLNADKTGMSALMKALKQCACKKSDKLPGGKGDTKDISDFDAKEVEMGLKVEMEHTKDREVAQEIVADHLSEDSSYYSKLKGSGLADELKKAGRCWEGYEPTPGKKPYSKGSCRKIKKLQKNDNEEYDFNTLEELQNHLNENHPLKIDEELASNYAAQSNNHYFDPYSDDVVKYRDYYTAHPSIDNDKFEETYLNHFDTLDQMHRRAGEKLKEDWENQKHKEWNEYKDKYENWANNILKTIHNHCGKDNYSVDEAKTTNSKYIWGTKGEDGPEFLIRLGDHPPKDEFDNEFNDKSKKTLSLLFPENTFMRSKNHQEWNKDFNRAQQKRLSFSSKHKIGDHTDVHDFLSNLDKSMQKSIKQKLIKALCVQKLQKSISAEAIEAGQYQGEKLDSHHHNRLGNEYKGMAQKAHKMGDRKKAREFHDKALHHFKMADKMGFQEEEPLEKKISGKVAAGLTALAAGLGGDMSSKPQPRPAPQVVQAAPQPPPQPTAKPIPKEKYPDLGSHDAISMIESSGGKDIYHKYVDKDKTQRAVSRYGFLPSRVIELYARNPEFRASEVGKMVGKIVEPELSKFKANNFYDTAKFVKTTPKHIQKQLYEQINKITENPKHDKVIFDADRKHSIESLSHLTSNPIELEIMATHAHHNFWPNTESLYMKGGIGAVIKDARSKEGNYVKKLHQNLPEGHPVKKQIEQFLPKEVKPQPKPPVKKASFHGS